MLNAIDKVGAIGAKALALRLRPLEDLPDPLLRLQSLEVIVAQMQLVGRLAARLALQVAALLDLGLLVLDDGLDLVLEGLLQQHVVAIQIQSLVQAAHEALQRLVVLEIEEGQLGATRVVQVSQVVHLAHGLDRSWNHLVLVVIVIVQQAHVEELELRH